MSVINAALRPLIDALLFPFRGMPAWVGVTVVSLVIAVVALWLVKVMSNPEKIDAAKRKVAAGLLEIRLYNDDLRRIGGAMGSIFKFQGIYVGLLMLPLLVMIVILAPVFSQLQFHWGYEGLEAGDYVLLTVEFQPDWESSLGADGGEGAPRPEIELELPAGMTLDSPPVWSPADREMSWRMIVGEDGQHEIGVQTADGTHTKSIAATDSLLRLSPIRHDGKLLDQLFYPAEPAFPKGSGLARAEFEYPERSVWHMPWWLLLLILSLVFGLILRGPMGVTI
jgi:hypothetical protein